MGPIAPIYLGLQHSQSISQKTQLGNGPSLEPRASMRGQSEGHPISPFILLASISVLASSVPHPALPICLTPLFQPTTPCPSRLRTGPSASSTQESPPPWGTDSRLLSALSPSMFPFSLAPPSMLASCRHHEVCWASYAPALHHGPTQALTSRSSAGSQTLTPCQPLTQHLQSLPP